MRLPLTLAALLSLAPAARADLPPPRGIKRVSYSFEVTNLDRHPAWLLIAYPCNGSNGRPFDTGTVIRDASAVGVGRSGGVCPLYAVPKSTFDAWAKGRTLGHEGDGMDEFLSSKDVVSCRGRPSPRHEVPVKGPDRIHEKLRIKQLDERSCVLETDDAKPAK